MLHRRADSKWTPGSRTVWSSRSQVLRVKSGNGAALAEEGGSPILLYDGVCGLCNRIVQFVLKKDRKGTIRFASLQSSFAGQVLARHGSHAADLDTVYLLLNFDARDGSKEVLLSRSDAVLSLMKHLGGIWRLLAQILGLLPRPVRDWSYRQVARNRYRIFGQYETCPLPSESTQSRFLDL